MVGAFTSELTPLTVRNPETGRLLTANIYTIDGLEGEFSMGQLVMAICLSRAVDIENELIEVMRDVDATSSRLDTLTQIQERFVDWFDNHGAGDKFTGFGEEVSFTYDGKTIAGSAWRDFLRNTCEMTLVEVPDGDLTKVQVESLIDSLSDRMDAYNSISQDQLIRMESLTMKRDQTYDMVTNILKTVNTQLLGNAGNV